MILIQSTKIIYENRDNCLVQNRCLLCVLNCNISYKPFLLISHQKDRFVVTENR